MTAPTIDPLTKLAKDDPVEPGDLLAAWNDYARRWRTFRVWKVVTHRGRNQYGSNHTHANRTLHLVREIDAVPAHGTGVAHTHWPSEAGYHQINHLNGYHLVARTDAGRAWVDAQRAIEAQDKIDEAVRQDAERRSPAQIAHRLKMMAAQVEEQARMAERRAEALHAQADTLRAEAKLVQGLGR